ncbi:hypothetical protein AA0115_g10773 [Alternaria tenuissima]|jgi:hypothetical protein|uniref:Uncharacterized protein n=1 Tax=Alternaria tenuissima TaxID=119927 RepID=A0AB37W367_9PLEO|nr:hypothetical protein AA0115_g10773 [Alternaria tenuissima]
MSLPPMSSTKHTFLPLVAEPHPRSDKASPLVTASQTICTSTTEPTILTTNVVPQMVDQDPPLLQPPLPLPLPPHDDQRPITTAGQDVHAGENKQESEKLTANPWPVPHAVEHQKHVWYGSMLGMGTSKVQDKWGFSSASVSRSHTPDASSKC